MLSASEPLLISVKRSVIVFPRSLLSWVRLMVTPDFSPSVVARTGAAPVGSVAAVGIGWVSVAAAGGVPVSAPTDCAGLGSAALSSGSSAAQPSAITNTAGMTIDRERLMDLLLRREPAFFRVPARRANGKLVWGSRL